MQLTMPSYNHVYIAIAIVISMSLSSVWPPNCLINVSLICHLVSFVLTRCYLYGVGECLYDSMPAQYLPYH